MRARSGKERNPQLGSLQILARWRDLMMDPDPSTLEVALDLLIENDVTLADISAAFRFEMVSVHQANIHEEGERVIAGVFVLPPWEDANAVVDARAQVSWAIIKHEVPAARRRTTTNRYLPVVMVQFHGHTWKIQHSFTLRGTLEIAVADAVQIAWRAASYIKRYPDKSVDDIRFLSFDTTPSSRAVDPPQQLLAPAIGKVSGRPPAEWNTVPATPIKSNPTRSDVEVLRTLQELLLERDPPTPIPAGLPPSIVAAQDLLLEHEMTLVEASERMFHANLQAPPLWAEGDDTRHGSFEVSRFDYGDGRTGGEGVSWYVAPTSTGEKYFAHVSVIFHADGSRSVGRDPEGFMDFEPVPDTTFDMTIPTSHRFDDPSVAARVATSLAWQAVIALKRIRGETNARLVKAAINAGVAIPVVQISEIPPALYMGFEKPRENPAWTTNALADAFESMASQIPANWLPKLDHVRGGPRNTLVAELVEYGCGAYGCVLPTNDERVVLKVTTDETEAEFATQLAADMVAPICVEYYMAISLAVKHKGRPVFVLWRESADDVGQVEEILGDAAGDAVLAQHKAAQEVFAAFHDDDRDLDKLIAAWRKKTEAMGKTSPELRDLAKGLLHVFERQHIFFGDIHAGNLGRVFRGGEQGQWVITDPGHVAVIES